MSIATVGVTSQRALAKFEDPDWTAKGERRASVTLDKLDTLWINTGTLCNITCVHCYIESSPENDRLVYITAAEAATYYDEIHERRLGTLEIAFTGGEPFLNPEFPAMLRDALERGFEVLVLTNAMLPMLRPKVREALLEINGRFRDRLRLRVSLDHFTEAKHNLERGKGVWAKSLKGLDWLTANRFRMAIAGRTCWHETEAQSRAGYAALIAARGWPIDPASPIELSLLPEMDGRHDVPEITTACWGILKKSPSDLMCASSRMVVKRKGADRPTVLPCTLIAYDGRFDMGPTLATAAEADGGMFAKGAVKLNHAHCAKFCVLGGGACSAKG